MTDNPYAPPNAAVGEVPAQPPADRPREVTRAVVVLAVLWAVQSLAELTHWKSDALSGGISNRLFGLAVSASLAIWVYGKIHEGRNWARILQGFIAILGVALLAFMVILSIRAGSVGSIVDFVIAVISVAGNIYATWLLFAFPGKAWFRNRSE